MAFSTNLRSSSGSSGQGRGGERQVTYGVPDQIKNIPYKSLGVPDQIKNIPKAVAPLASGWNKNEQAQQAAEAAMIAEQQASAKAQADKLEQERFQRAKIEAERQAEIKRQQEVALAQQQAANQAGADTVGWLGRTSVLGPDWSPGDPIPADKQEYNIIGNKVSELGKQAVEGVKNLSLLGNLNLDTKPKDPKNLSWWDKFKMNLDQNVLDDEGNMIASSWSTPDSATYMNPETFDYGGISNPWEDIKAIFGGGKTTTAGAGPLAGATAPTASELAKMTSDYEKAYADPNTWDAGGALLDPLSAPRNYGDPAISYPPTSIDDLANMSLPSNAALTNAWNNQYGGNMSLPSNAALTNAWNNQYGTNYPMDHSSVVEPELIGNIPGKYAYSDTDKYKAAAGMQKEALTTPPERMDSSQIRQLSRRGFKWNPVKGIWEVNTGRVWQEGPPGSSGEITPQVDAAGTTDYPMNHSQIVNPWTPEVPVSNPYRHVPRVAEPQGFLKRNLPSGDVDYMNSGGVVHANQGYGGTALPYTDALGNRTNLRTTSMPMAQWMAQNEKVRPKGMTWEQFLQMQMSAKARQEAATSNSLNQQKAKQQQQKQAFGTLLGIANPTAGSMYNAYSAYANDGGVVYANEGTHNTISGMPKEQASWMGNFLDKWGLKSNLHRLMGHDAHTQRTHKGPGAFDSWFPGESERIWWDDNNSSEPMPDVPIGKSIPRVGPMSLTEAGQLPTNYGMLGDSSKPFMTEMPMPDVPVSKPVKSKTTTVKEEYDIPSKN